MTDPLQELLLIRQKSSEEADKSFLKQQLINSGYQDKQAYYEKALERKQRLKQLEDERNLLDIYSKSREDRSLGEAAKDSAISLVKGVQSVGQTVYGVADLLSRFSPVTLDEATAKLSSEDKAFSQKFNENREFLNQSQSEQINAERAVLEHKAQLRAQESAKNINEDSSLLDRALDTAGNFAGAVKDFASAPSSVIDTTLESLPLMLGPGAIAQQANKKLVQKLAADSPHGLKAANKFLASKAGKKELQDIATKTGVGFTAVSEGVSNGLQVQGEILSAKHEDLLESSPEYNRLISSENKSPQEAKRILANKAGLITTGVAGLFAGASSKLSGAGTFEGSLFKLDSKIGKNILTKTASTGIKGAVTEGVEEAAQGATGQLATNIAKQKTIDPKQDLTEGVTEASAQGLVAGAASGGGLATVASIPGNTKESLINFAQKTKERAEKNTGNTAEVKQAVKTGDTKEVLKEETTGEFSQPENALNTLFQTVPEDNTQLMGHFKKAAQAYHEIQSKVVENNKKGIKDEALEKRFESYSTQFGALKQHTLLNHKKPAETLVKDIKSDKPPSKSPETNDRIENAVTVFGSSSFESKEGAKAIQQQAQTILDSGLASKEQAIKLKNTIASAKSYGQVTGDILNGKSQKFIGVNTHRDVISSNVSLGKQELAKTNLSKLEKFKESHETKLSQLKEGFEAFKTPESKRSPEQKAAIQLAESRKRINGTNFKITEKTGGLINQIEKEVTALEATTTEMAHLVNTMDSAPSSTESDVTGTSTTETVSEAPDLAPDTVTEQAPAPKEVKKVKSKEPAPDLTKPTEVAYGNFTPKQVIKNLRETPLSTLQEKLKSITNNKTPVRDDQIKNLIKAVETGKNLTPARVKILSELSNQLSKDTPKSESTVVTEPTEGASLEVVKETTEILKSKDGNKLLAQANKLDLDTHKETKPIDTIITKESTEKRSVIDDVFETSIKTKSHISKKDGTEVNKGSDTFFQDNFNKIESRQESILNSIPDLFSKLEKGEHTKNLSEKQKIALKPIIKFRNDFTKNLLKAISPKDKAFIYQDSFQHFLKDSYDPKSGKPITEEDINPNVLSTMAMVSLNWLTTQASQSIFNDKLNIAGILGRKDSKYTPTTYETKLFSYLGTAYNPISKELGSEILNKLGIKSKKTVNGNIEQDMEISMANHAMQAMLSMNLVQQNTIPAFILDGLKSGKPESELLAEYETKLTQKGKSKFVKEVDQVIPFIQVSLMEDDTKYGGVSALTYAGKSNKVGPGDLINIVKDSDKLLDTLFDIESKKSGPVFEKPKGLRDEVVTNTLRNGLKVSQKIRTKLSKVQQIAYTLRNNILNMEEFLGQDNVLDILGSNLDYKNKVHVSEIDAIEGKNKTNLNEYLRYQEFKKDIGDVSRPFYFKHNVQTNGRMLVDSKTMNHQSSHFHRILYGVDSHKETIDPKNEEQVNKFMRALAATLGEKTEKYNNVLPPI